MDIWKSFHGLNSGYVMDLYERYVRDPSSVDPATETIFKGWKPDSKYSSLRVGIEPEIEKNGFNQSPVRDVNKAVAIANMAQAIRRHGHLESRIDPLGGPVRGDLTLHAETFGLEEEELRDFPPTLVGWPLSQNSLDALDGIRKLRRIYSSTIGYNYDHIYEAEERRWMRGAIESGVYRPPLNPVDEVELLDTLTRVEVFESFLHRIFPGKFRFSIEGVDMLVPMLNELIRLAIESHIHQIILGMAHRGRLNVMHHVMDKEYKYTLLKFKDPLLVRDFTDDMGWTGDVKYHEAVRRDIPTGEMLDRKMRITMAPNPSHLESVNPVVQGMSRACGTSDATAGNPKFDPSVVIPVQIHGDSAFMGQGINAETLNLSALPGYRAGGTIHIITNNQLGYTTLPSDSRSTLYASDLAKGFEIPIVHVNADDPVACIESIRLAFGYTSKFEKHFLIDLVGYRRYGHNEADEPGFTQPMTYKKIDEHPRVLNIWAGKLTEKGTVTEKQVEQIREKYIAKITGEFESISPDESPEESTPPSPEQGIAKKTVTGLEDKALRELNDSLLTVPQGFIVNSKIAKIRDRRK
ncbi:MAG: thiamine pyrophosphate-dependent enzyme, partial [Candidatus Dadabacteria bacterium]|nr:thiamine pyrophosphate-dependent enzyme [Candidatus Dadabacteria bacterium]